MVDAVRAIRAVIHNPQKASEVRESLAGLSQDEKEKQRLIKTTRIKPSSEITTPYKFVTDLEGNDVLEISKDKFQEIKAQTNVENQGESISHEEKDQLIGLSKHEDSVFGALNNVRHFWHRAYGRRTGLFSWILSWTLKYAGFDDIEQVDKTLVDPQFVKGFAEYKKKDSKEEANIALENNFKDNKSKQSLAKLALTTLNLFDKLPNWLVSVFPPIFCIQNVAVPFLKKFFFTEGPINIALNAMQIINPWLDEFASTLMGVFKKEINGAKQSLKAASEARNDDQPKRIEDDSQINSVVITDLGDEKQYKLKGAVDKVNQAFERLLGRKSNISSLVAHVILKCYGFDGYKDFAKKTIEKEGFIQNLNNLLSELGKKDNGNNGEVTIFDQGFSEKLIKHFPDTKERQVAKILLSVISMTNNLSDNFIKNGPRTFGSIYSFQYLFMPIISKLVGHEGLLGKLCGFVAFVNPILNDLLLDPVATFQEEVLGVRKTTEPIKDLFPRLGLSANPINYVVKTGKLVWNSVQNFAKERFKTAPEPAA